MSFVDYETKYPWANNRWAIREALKFGVLGNLLRSWWDYWLLFKDRDAYIDKHYSEAEIEE